MKHSLLALIVLAAGAVGAGAASVTADSKVTEVTVYQDRALVTRSAEARLTGGEQQVVFEGLPVGLDENSVRARGIGKGFKILGVEIRRDYQKVGENEQTKKLREQIKVSQQKTQDLDDERNDLNQKRELLKRLSDNLGGGGEKQPPTVADIKSLTEYYGTQISAISTRLRAIERGRNDLNEQINDLNKQLALLIQPGSPDKRSVVVTVDAVDADTAKLQVDYLIHGCSWQPQYDVHYQAGEKNLALTAYGIIRQNSGENWDSVRVTLSTARPQQGTSLPDLTAWMLNVRQLMAVGRAAAEPTLKLKSDNTYTGQTMVTAGTLVVLGEQRSNVTKTGRDELLAGYALDATEFQTADVVTQGFSAVHKVPAAVTVPSDGQPHRCTISIMDLPAEQSYVSTPKLNPGAFVKAKVKNAGAAPLLPGQLNVFMGNDFVGASRLSLIGPEGVFDLFLGKDDTIKVQRKDKTRKEETGGVFTKSKIVKTGYTVELENFQAKEVVVALKDQIPVSQNEKIKVSYKSSVKPAEENKETGELTWNIAVPAKGKVVVDVDFQAEFPPEVVVDGI